MKETCTNTISIQRVARTKITIYMIINNDTLENYIIESSNVISQDN